MSIGCIYKNIESIVVTANTIVIIFAVIFTFSLVAIKMFGTVTTSPIADGVNMQRAFVSIIYQKSYVDI